MGLARCKVGCKIVDFRSFHPFHNVGTQHIVNELYLKDQRLQLATSLHLLCVRTLATSSFCIDCNWPDIGAPPLSVRLMRLVESIQHQIAGSMSLEGLHPSGLRKLFH